MRIAVGQFSELTDEMLRFAVQIGVSGVQMNTPRLPGTTRWEVADLRELVRRCEAHGLSLEAIENVPITFYDRAMLGLPGADAQIANYQETIRAIGAAGIPVLGYHFMPNGVWRTSRTTPGRGGVAVTSFDMALVEAAERDGNRDEIARRDGWIKAEVMWANYATFMRAILPVAREAGVVMALHPDDPPVAAPLPMLGDVARLFSDVDGFKQAERIAEESGAGDAWALDLCLGCCSEMPDGAQNVTAMIEYFGPRGSIAYVHFRDVQGTMPAFQECFLGEGNWDPAEIMLLLKRNGFTGFLLDDHVPHMDGDTSWGHRGRAQAIGYMQGLLAMIERAAA
jgi:mannonate dehydratase